MNTIIATVADNRTEKNSQTGHWVIKIYRFIMNNIKSFVQFESVQLLVSCYFYNVEPMPNTLSDVSLTDWLTDWHSLNSNTLRAPIYIQYIYMCVLKWSVVWFHAVPIRNWNKSVQIRSLFLDWIRFFLLVKMFINVCLLKKTTSSSSESTLILN